MEVIVISESLIIRKGTIEILKNEDYIKKITHSYLYTDIYTENYDLVFIDLNKNNRQYLYDLQELKKKTNIKIIVLDFYEDSILFSECMKIGVDGYILANIDSEDICYAVKQIYRGKKYFDVDLIEKYLSKSCTKYIEGLTKREQEILVCIGKGKSNLEISKELCITEHTVKKHTSNILTKLNVKDRTQAALYAYDKGIVGL